MVKEVEFPLELKRGDDDPIFASVPFSYWDEESDSFRSIFEGADVEILVWESAGRQQCRVMAETPVEFPEVTIRKYSDYLGTCGHSPDSVTKHIALLRSPIKAKLKEKRGRWSYTEIAPGGGVKAGKFNLTFDSSGEILAGGVAVRLNNHLEGVGDKTYRFRGSDRQLGGAWHGEVTTSADDDVALTLNDPANHDQAQAALAVIKSKFTVVTASEVGLETFNAAAVTNGKGNLEELYDALRSQGPGYSWFIYTVGKTAHEGKGATFFIRQKVDSPFLFVDGMMIAPASALSELDALVEAGLESGNAKVAAEIQRNADKFRYGPWYEAGSQTPTPGLFVYGHNSSFEELIVEFSQLDSGVRAEPWKVRVGRAEITWAKFRPAAFAKLIEGQLSSQKLSREERSKLERAQKEIATQTASRVGVTLYTRGQRLPLDPLSRIDVNELSVKGKFDIKKELLLDDDGVKITWGQAAKRVATKPTCDCFYAVVDEEMRPIDMTVLIGNNKSHIVFAELGGAGVEFMVATKSNSLAVTDVLTIDEALLYLQEGYELVYGSALKRLEKADDTVCGALGVTSLDELVIKDDKGVAFSVHSINLPAYDVRRYYNEGYLPYHTLADSDRDYVALVFCGTQVSQDVKEGVIGLLGIDLGEVHLRPEVIKKLTADA